MTQTRGGRLYAEWWLVLLALAGLVALAVASGVTNRFDNLYYDAAQRRLAHHPDDNVLIVALDNQSLGQLGAWPWPRETMGQLIGEIGKAKPKAVALDVLLMESRSAEGDAALAAAMRTVPVFLPLQFEVPGYDNAAYSVSKPLPIFGEVAAGLGQVNIVPDEDGLIRRVYLEYRDGDRQWVSMAQLLHQAAKIPAVAEGGAGELEATEPMLIDFVGPAGSFPMVSAVSVMRGEVPPELLKGRRILIGMTASGMGDVYATPAAVDGSLMPGVEIQANILSTLGHNRGVAPMTPVITFSYAFAVLLVMMTMFRFLQPRWTLLAMVGLAVLVALISFALLSVGRIWLPPAAALLGIALAYPLWSWRRLAVASNYLTAELERSEPPRTGLLTRHDPTELPSDALDRQIELLRQAIQRERDLAHFLNDRMTQMPDCVLVTDTGGNVVFANSGATRLFADLNGGVLTQADLLLRHLFTSKPTGRSALSFAAATLTNGVAWSCEAEAQDGSSFDVRFEPQRNSTDTLVGYVIRIVDNTALVTSQRQRNDALQLLSHDMRAPQSSILALLESVGHGDKKGVIPDGVVDRIRGYARRTLKLSDDFVHLARAQMLEFEFEELDLVQIAVEAADSLWPQAHERGIELVIDAEDEDLPIQGNASLLSRMMINLIDNAIKFSNEGEPVEISVRPVTVGGKQFARFAVTNGGQGVPADRLSMLDLRFQSSAPTGTTGAGLGLAFVHTVVVRHRGTISCDTAEDGPTTFSVELPLELS